MTGRTKSVYSTWTKLQRLHCGIDGIHDLVALRVVLNPEVTTSPLPLTIPLTLTLTPTLTRTRTLTLNLTLTLPLPLTLTRSTSRPRSRRQIASRTIPCRGICDRAWSEGGEEGQEARWGRWGG